MHAHTYIYMQERIHTLTGEGVLDRLQNRSTRVRTPVGLLHSLSGQYPWERYEPLIIPTMG